MTAACVGGSRAALLAGASLIALAAFGAPGSAFACANIPQTISVPTIGTVESNGSSIAVLVGGSIQGSPNAGVSLSPGCSITTLTNSGSITGLSNPLGQGFSGVANAPAQAIGTLSNQGTIAGGSGTIPGAGVLNTGPITTLTNSGIVSGGNGSAAFTNEAGAAGVGNFAAGTIGSFTNSKGAMIVGGAGSSGGSAGGVGGAGVLNSGTHILPQGVISTLSNSGMITGGTGGGGSLTGGAGGAGVANTKGQLITEFDNNAGGIIAGGNGASPGGAGGAGVSNIVNAQIGSLNNSGMINGGAGGSGLTGGPGGAGVLNAAGATITELTNNKGATIAGNAGGSGLVHGGTGGAGLSNSGMIGTSGPITLGIDNKGSILGGLGGSSAGAGGAGVSNAHGGTIAVLSNSGTIRGGEGGRGVDGGVGGAGVTNAGVITTLTNNAGAMISGGMGGTGGGFTGVGGAGGAGVSNTGTITTLTNYGTISAGAGGFGSVAGPPGTGVRNTGVGFIGTLLNLGMISGGTYAIYSPGPGSIGSLTSPTGHTIGNVLVDPVAPFVITGGSGKNFGFFSGGTITVLGGDLVFEGNIDLADDINVNSGGGTVANDGVLRLSTPETITGNFEQTSSGALEFLLGGDMSGEYGALNVSGRVTLDGELELATTGGFHWTGGDTFDLMTYSPDGGSFNGVSLGGVACTATLTTVWDCGGGFNLDLIVGTNGVEATILSIPEPSTWAMLATGFAGLGFAGYRASRRTAVSVWTNRRAPREP